jgi:transposase
MTKSNQGKRLPPEKRERLLEMLREGREPVDIAKEVGCTAASVYQTRSKLGLRPAPASNGERSQGAKLSQEQAEAINADILAGMSEDDIRKKHGIGRATIYRHKQRVNGTVPATVNGVTHQADTALVRRVVAFVSRLGEKYPSILLDMDIPGRVVKRNPALLMELI